MGVPALTWSDTVAASAQAWADNVIAKGDLVHSTGSGYGESIGAWGLGGKTPAQLAQTWADEKSQYIPGTTWSFANGHYTAMVDKKSTRLAAGWPVDLPVPMDKKHGMFWFVNTIHPETDSSRHIR